MVSSTAMAIPRLPNEPILGSLRLFNAQRLGFLCAVAGASPAIARIRLGPMRAVVVNDPALIGAILVEHGEAFEGSAAAPRYPPVHRR